MNKFRFTIQALAIAIFMCAFASLAQAQATRTWVSGVGDDANPCSRTAPCKTFAGAISKTAACGEIDALDPGGFGAVTITKSITIDGTPFIAGVLVSGTNGIVISAASTDVITLRGLDINGICAGLNGIRVLQAKTVNIENTVIYRFTQNGIDVAETDGVNLNVRNTVIRDNTGDGVSLTTTSGLVKATFDNCGFTGNGNGLHAKAGSRATARNSVLSNNGTNGVFADAAGAGTVAVARVWSSQISFNGGNGVRSGNVGNSGISVVEIAQNQIDNNTGNGVLVSAGGVGTAVNTFTNNSITGNGADGCPGCTSVGPGA